MVKCRSQRDLDNGMTPAEARDKEKLYFSEHPDWREVRRPVLGVAHLTSSLTALLVDRIQISLPFIKWELQAQLEKAERDAAPLGTSIHDEPLATQSNRLMQLMSTYCSVLRQSTRGFYSDSVLAVSGDLRLFGRCQEAYEALKHAILSSRPGFGDPIFGQRLAADMVALRGRELPGFHNSQAFYNFVASCVEAWRPAVEHCRVTVVQSARAVSARLLEKLAPAYPALAFEVTLVANRLINDLADCLSEKLDDIFVKESDPFTTNENMLELINQLRFRNFDRALEQVMASVAPARASGEESEAEAALDPKVAASELQATVVARLGGWYMSCHGVNVKSKVEDMTIMIEAYWDVATKRLVDNVCMTMEHDFLGKLLKQLEAECFVIATDSMGPKGAEHLARLFSEDAAIMERRRGLIAKRNRLGEALKTLRAMAPDCVATQQLTAQ
jgi:interferon-induced GTP-binding protein Mx1